MESPTRYQACAKDGRDTILESVAEAAGANNWEDISVQALLMGTDQAGTPRVWTLRDLEAFQSNALPCWVLRYCANSRSCLRGTLTQTRSCCEG